MAEDSGILQQQPAEAEQAKTQAEPPVPQEDQAAAADKEYHVLVGVAFERSGKIYYFRQAGVECEIGDQVLARTEKGMELGEVVAMGGELEGEGAATDAKPLVRKATEKDLRRAEELRRREQEALGICEEKIRAHGLPMKLIDASYSLDAKHLTFYFSAEQRVDFRQLVRDLAQTFHCRIELHQIGVRDEAKRIGGLGPCGRPLCCATFLRNFSPVSIRFAKEQGLALNPGKISGICDRLMCCLRYEHEIYQELAAQLPSPGEEVITRRGKGRVSEVLPLKGHVVVKLEDNETVELSAAEVGWPGHPLQDEQVEEAVTEPEPVETVPQPAEEPAQQKPRSKRGRRGRRSRRQPTQGSGSENNKPQQGRQAAAKDEGSGGPKPAGSSRRSRRSRRARAQARKPQTGKSQ